MQKLKDLIEAMTRKKKFNMSCSSSWSKYMYKDGCRKKKLIKFKVNNFKPDEISQNIFILKTPVGFIIFYFRTYSNISETKFSLVLSYVFFFCNTYHMSFILSLSVFSQHFFLLQIVFNEIELRFIFGLIIQKVNSILDHFPSWPIQI